MERSTKTFDVWCERATEIGFELFERISRLKPWNSNHFNTMHLKQHPSDECQMGETDF